MHGASKVLLGAAALLVFAPAALAGPGEGIRGFLETPDPVCETPFDPAAETPAVSIADFASDLEPLDMGFLSGRLGTLEAIGRGGIRVPVPVPVPIPRPRVVPIPVPHAVPGPGAPMWGGKRTGVAWLLSFLIPGLGQYYVGGAGGVTLGTVHLSIAALSLTALLVVEDDEAIVACAVAYIANWLVNWIDAIILCTIHNRRAYAVGAVVEYDPETRALGMGLKMRF